MKNFEKHHTGTERGSGDEQSQWQAARKLAALIGDPPRFVRATIHFLRLDVEENNNELSHRARSCLLPLLRSQEFKAVLYYAAKTFFPERLESISLDNPRKLAKLFKPKEFIAILSVMYLYRRMKKGCHKESFQSFTKNVFSDWLLAGATGKALERLGFADGLIYGTFPQLAQCLFLGVDRKTFKSYRVHIRMQQRPFDLAYEVENWNCNCLQVAVLLAQYLGLGRHYHDPFMLGLASDDYDSFKNSDSLYGASLLRVWVNALRETKDAPDMLHRGEFYPFASEMKRLTQFARELGSLTIEDAFFEKGKEDVSPDTTPELFTDGEPPKETEINTLEELPEEIRDDFPEDIDLDEVLG